MVDPNSTCQDMGTCSDCGQACLSKDVNYTDWLFDLDADPREEHNLVTIYPEVRRRLIIIFSVHHVWWHEEKTPTRARGNRSRGRCTHGCTAGASPDGVDNSCTKIFVLYPRPSHALSRTVFEQSCVDR